MKLRMILFNAISSAVIMFHSGVEAQTENALIHFMGVTGICDELVIQNEPILCKKDLFHSEYESGRLGFWFFSDDGKTSMSFTGYGQNQIKIDANTRRFDLDAVVLTSGKLPATGNCFFENPFIGQAKIECEAQDRAGKLYKGKFLTDGSKPKIIIPSKNQD